VKPKPSPVPDVGAELRAQSAYKQAALKQASDLSETAEGLRARDAVNAFPPVNDLPLAPKRRRPRKFGSRREKQSIAKVRSQMALLLESSAPHFQDWFAKAVEANPLKAMVLLKDLMEFYMPKLGRIEQTGTVEHKVSHFVPMIQREEPPAGYLGGRTGAGDVIDGEVIK
jgi:hypothetical protein